MIEFKWIIGFESDTVDAMFNPKCVETVDKTKARYRGQEVNVTYLHFWSGTIRCALDEDGILFDKLANYKETIDGK